MNHLERLLRLRKEREEGQKVLASVLGVTQTAYSKWELGQREIPLSKLLILARYYNVSMDYIKGASNVRTPFPKK